MLPPLEWRMIYCFSSLRWVEGGADPTKGNSLLNKIFPFLLSKIYTFLSNVPVAIAMLPAVAVTPPKFSVPVFGKPFFLS